MAEEDASFMLFNKYLVFISYCAFCEKEVYYSSMQVLFLTVLESLDNWSPNFPRFDGFFSCFDSCSNFKRFWIDKDKYSYDNSSSGTSWRTSTWRILSISFRMSSSKTFSSFSSEGSSFKSFMDFSIITAWNCNVENDVNWMLDNWDIQISSILWIQSTS